MKTLLQPRYKDSAKKLPTLTVESVKAAYPRPKFSLDTLTSSKL